MQIRNELWEAVSSVPLHEGDRVKVVAGERTRLRVERVDASAAAWAAATSLVVIET